jgi:hypothetical protein
MVLMMDDGGGAAGWWCREWSKQQLAGVAAQLNELSGLARGGGWIRRYAS